MCLSRSRTSYQFVPENPVGSNATFATYHSHANETEQALSLTEEDTLLRSATHLTYISYLAFLTLTVQTAERN